ncbi:MAG: putative ABC transporter ATP-binding protein YheS [Bacteroidia bacterium]|nr:putative ABC transporter ATP-binding protein YheS [Bacteroidia bacterium]
MISVNRLSVQFGGSALFDDVSFLVNARDRIGLTGKNGAGKSTMLKILAKQQQPSEGEVAIQNDCTLGYLPQEMHLRLGKTVFDETETAFVEAKELEKKIEYYNEQLATRTDYESDSYSDLIVKLNEANERYNMIGGYTMQADIELVLFGLGFERKDLNRLTDEFSGGWRMRIELAKILLQKPSVMLLDEPTNHLDIESIQWLEDFLKNYAGAVVLVSHDKAFLDNITTRTIEISLGKIYDYKANYSKYVQLRKERREQQQAAFANQEKYIEHTEMLINKFRAKASKASMAQSLIKKLDKIERIEVDEEDNATLRFKFPPAPRSGKVVVEAENVAKRYGDKTIFSNVDFMIEREERIAFVGKNGEGKSTLSKIIAGVESHEGKLQIGYNVSIGYFAQNQAEILDGEKTVFQTIDDVAEGEVRKNVRSLLGSFLFGGDAIDKKVKVLSGGEKNRLALCKLLLQPYNLLIMDEPTNHLDMRSKEMLKTALLNYDGTLIVVSHDRDFLQGLTGKVFEFRNGNIKTHIGDLQEFLASRKIQNLAQLEVKTQANGLKKEDKEKLDAKHEHEAKKKQEKELKHAQNAVEKSEKEIERLEKLIKEMDDNLLDPVYYQEALKDNSVFERYNELKSSLEKELLLWEERQAVVERLQ